MINAMAQRCLINTVNDISLNLKLTSSKLTWNHCNEMDLCSSSNARTLIDKDLDSITLSQGSEVQNLNKLFYAISQLAPNL